jgi:LPXTG-motif cell wall-anchored protein
LYTAAHIPTSGEDLNMLKRILLITSLPLLLSALLAVTVAAQGAGDPAKGKAAWAQYNCKSCHGDNGEGKYAGVRAGDGKTAADWIKQVRTPRANMPAYAAAQISDTVLTDMWAYMQTLPKPASFTPVSTTVAPTDLPGRQVMVDKRCVACHGNVQAFVKSRFVDQNREPTTEAVLKQLRTPARNMPTFSATQVTDAQAALIADYFKAQVTAIRASAAVTTTAPVTPTVAPKPATAPAPAAPAALPKTGGGLNVLALGGLSLLSIGAAFMLRERRG